jgi:MFS family permease
LDISPIFGRKKLFLITLGIYLTATVATAAALDFWSFAILRFLTGLGIGGEYAAINSAIDELIPARARGWADLGINGSYWLGAAIGAGLAAVLLNPDLLPRNVGWRIAFGLGAILGLCILLVRRRVPESPRWMMLHGHFEGAEKIVRGIEAEVQKRSRIRGLPSPEKSIEIRRRRTVGFSTIARTMFRKYPKRSLLGFILMGTQAFVYNAILFTHTVTPSSSRYPRRPQRFSCCRLA